MHPNRNSSRGHLEGFRRVSRQENLPKPLAADPRSARPRKSSRNGVGRPVAAARVSSLSVQRSRADCGGANLGQFDQSRPSGPPVPAAPSWRAYPAPYRRRFTGAKRHGAQRGAGSSTSREGTGAHGGASSRLSNPLSRTRRPSLLLPAAAPPSLACANAAQTQRDAALLLHAWWLRLALCWRCWRSNARPAGCSSWLGELMRPCNCMVSCCGWQLRCWKTNARPVGLYSLTSPVEPSI